YGMKSPMTVLNFSTLAELPAEFVTLFVLTSEAPAELGKFFQITERREASVRAYRFQRGADEHSFYFAAGGKSWKCGAVTSDAEFVCWSMQPGRMVVRFCHGTYVKIEGQSELRCKRAVARYEVVRSPGQEQVFCSEMDAVERNAN